MAITQAGQIVAPPPSCTFQLLRYLDVRPAERQVFLQVTPSHPSCRWSVGAFSTLAADKTWAVAGQTVTLIQCGTLPENSACSSINGSAVSIGLTGNNPPRQRRG